MQKFILTSVLLLVFSTLFTQVPDDYFQQQTNYDIDVALDDSLHILTGTTDIEYINHSKDKLTEIYLHLWPNAFKNKRTAFTKQMVENGSTNFYFSKYESLGGYKDIEIKVNGKVVEWDYWEENPDIALIALTKALDPGASLVINTRFEMKIPDSFSRLGHVGQSYQMTQWYPKPAVYDKEGWHPMPYLDQGEFYSEFGNFDVSITLPKNYVIGATGEVQSESELSFLNEKIKETRRKIKANEIGINKIDRDSFPTSDSEMKTIQYKAENVHDFAWFADKRFYVEKSEVILASGKQVDTYVMFTEEEGELWTRAIDYVDRSIKFYSEKVGEYPYPHATAVQSALSAGGGMEYPMITVIGLSGSDKSLDEVITHEVGHNWFYGLLASNERDHAWMDEGFNSYYEHEYMDKYYSDDKSSYGNSVLSGASESENSQLSFYVPMRRRTDQSINTPSQDLRQLNYWIAAYTKPAYLFEYLEQYLGIEAFDALMQKYFETWAYKHPQPDDVRALFEKETGKDLSWLFDGLINSVDPLDYKVKSVDKVIGSYNLKIENKGKINAPFPIQVIEENKIVKTIWVEGFEGEKTISVDVAGADKFVLDAENIMPDFYRSNNTITAKGGKFEPLKLKFLGGIENSRNTSLYYTPIIGMNSYDGFQLGMALYNTVLPSKNLEWSVAPMFGFKSKNIGGLANIRYHLYPDNLQRVTLEIGYRGFSYDYNKDFYSQFDDVKSNLNYNRIRTSLDFELNKKRARSNKKQIISLELIAMNASVQGEISVDTTIVPDPDPTLIYSGHKNEWSFVPRLKYHISNKRALTPYEFNALLEQHSYDGDEGYAKLSLEVKTKFFYKEKKAFHIRAFAGMFLYNTKSDILSRALGAYSLADQGSTDFWADDFYFGRNEDTGFFSQQIHMNQGGFKTTLNNTSLGSSNRGLYAVNIKLDLPMNLPNYIPSVRPYVDLAYVDAKSNSTFNDGLFAQAGIAIEFLGERIGIYLPIAGTENLQNQLKSKGNYPARISFMFDMNRMDPFKELYNFDL